MKFKIKTVVLSVDCFSESVKFLLRNRISKNPMVPYVDVNQLIQWISQRLIYDCAHTEIDGYFHRHPVYEPIFYDLRNADPELPKRFYQALQEVFPVNAIPRRARVTFQYSILAVHQK